MKGIFITATDTDAGKTFITAGIMYLLRKNNCNATYFKAALSGAEIEDGKLIPGDTHFVSKVSNLLEDYNLLTPFIYKTAVSPHLASNMEGNPVNLEIVLNNYNKLKKKYDYVVAEGSGGIICPLSWGENKILLEDLIKALNLSTILVTKATLGTINHTVLTVKYMESIGIKVKGIIVNLFDENNPCHRDNLKMIEELTSIKIIAVIGDGTKLSSEEERIEFLKNSFDKINPEKILTLMEEI
ncbi:MAG: dethiobiotin synthase [Sarcina sp.]